MVKQQHICYSLYADEGMVSQKNMKVSALLAVLISAMAVAAVPVADLDLDSAAAPVAAAVDVEARDLTRGQCKNACDRGADAMESFCRRIPERRVRAACWAAATAVQSPLGQRACVAFCDAWF